jgi:ribosomal-protein-alanine N-acetyltransferase
MDEPLRFAVEPMAVSDIGQIMEIENKAFSAPWSAQAYRYEITENEHSTMLVVRPVYASSDRVRRLGHFFGKGGAERVLGYCGLWLLIDQAHISTLAIHSDWRRRGLGELLLNSLLAQGMEQGARTATLEVRVSNHAAQALYSKYRFSVVSRRKRYYSDNNEDALIMTTPWLDNPEFLANLRHQQQQLLTRLPVEASRATRWISMTTAPANMLDGGHPHANRRGR